MPVLLMSKWPMMSQSSPNSQINCENTGLVISIHTTCNTLTVTLCLLLAHTCLSLPVEVELVSICMEPPSCVEWKL